MHCRRLNPAPAGRLRQAQPAACRPQRSGSPAKGCRARRGAPPRTDPARIVNARTLHVYASRTANARNDGTRDPDAAPMTWRHLPRAGTRRPAAGGQHRRPAQACRRRRRTGRAHGRQGRQPLPRSATRPGSNCLRLVSAVSTLKIMWAGMAGGRIVRRIARRAGITKPVPHVATRYGKRDFVWRGTVDAAPIGTWLRTRFHDLRDTLLIDGCRTPAAGRAGPAGTADVTVTAATLIELVRCPETRTPAALR